jgi:hypothetical protein
VWGAKEQRRRRGERKFSVVLTTELTKTTLPVWRRARTRGSEGELLIEVACELLVEVTCELLIEMDLEKIDGSGWCQERDKNTSISHRGGLGENTKKRPRKH